MKKFFVFALTITTLTSIMQEAFAYYTVEQIKYEQSLGRNDTQRRAMENPQAYERMYQDYYNKQNYENRNNYNNSSYTRERPLHRFGSSNRL